MQGADRDAMMRDVEAAIDAVRDVGSVAVVGFCLGGSLAYFAAARIEGLSAAVCFYGGLIAKASDEVPKCATQMHFGGQDHGIPVADVEAIRHKRPDCEVWLYPEAGHGFNCDERASFHAESAAIAWMRTGEWLDRHMK
jgi:carboxymethylenebutenolidase